MEKRESQNKKAEKEFFDKFNQEGGYDVLDEEGYKKILLLLPILLALFYWGVGKKL